MGYSVYLCIVTLTHLIVNYLQLFWLKSIIVYHRTSQEDEQDIVMCIETRTMKHTYMITISNVWIDMAKGYLCFVVSILGIGMVTAIIGDIASHFGCTLGIKDSVTAIAFVALGTSIPGTNQSPASIYVAPNWSPMRHRIGISNAFC